MTFTSKYLRMPALIFSFLFLFGFAGIHAVLHTCGMEGMACCDELSGNGHTSDNDGFSFQVPVLQHNMEDCCVSTTVSSIVSVLPETPSSHGSTGKQYFVKSFIPQNVDFTPSATSSFSLLRSPRLNQATSPTVATYIFNTSLLI